MEKGKYKGKRFTRVEVQLIVGIDGNLEDDTEAELDGTTAQLSVVASNKIVQKLFDTMLKTFS